MNTIVCRFIVCKSCINFPVGKQLQASSLEHVFGQILRNLRLAKGLSQEELGFESGYHRTYISLLERGLRNPSLKTIYKLADTLGVPTSEMIRRIEENYDPDSSSRPLLEEN